MEGWEGDKQGKRYLCWRDDDAYVEILEVKEKGKGRQISQPEGKKINTSLWTYCPPSLLRKPRSFHLTYNAICPLVFYANPHTQTSILKTVLKELRHS